MLKKCFDVCSVKEQLKKKWMIAYHPPRIKFKKRNTIIYKTTTQLVC